MALMFLNGGGMRGGPVHRHIDGEPLVAEVRTAPLYRFYSIRDEYPGLYPVAPGHAGGHEILGERAPEAAGRAYGTFLRSRPGDAENLLPEEARTSLIG